MSMGGGHSTQTTTQELSPEQRALLDPVIPIATEFLKNPPKQWQGTAIAGFNPLQQLAQRMTVNAAQQFNPMVQGNIQQFQGGVGQLGKANSAQLQAGLGTVGNQVDAQNFLLSGAAMDPNRNPALARVTQAAVDPLIQNFQQSVLPAIGDEAIAAGQFGGTRQGVAEGIATQSLNREVGNISANIQNNAYNQGLQAMSNLAAVGPANQAFSGIQQGFGALTSGLANSTDILSAGLLPAQLMSTVGEQQQALTQARLSETVQKFINKQLLPFSIAQDVAGMAFGVPAGTTKTTTEGGGGGGLQAMQMGMGLLSMLPMLGMFSDRRLKKVIEIVDQLADGLSVYVYQLVGDTASRIGLMAEEVFQLYPEAVSLDPSGYARVDYDKVPSWR